MGPSKVVCTGSMSFWLIRTIDGSSHTSSIPQDDIGHVLGIFTTVGGGRGPKDHIDIRILRSGSNTHDNGDSRIFVFRYHVLHTIYHDYMPCHIPCAIDRTLYATNHGMILVII